MHAYVIAAVAMASIVGTSVTALARQAQSPARTIDTLVLAAEPTKAFGEHREVANPVLKSGDHIHLYGEPGDFGWHVTNDVAGFHVVAAIEVRGRNGRITGKAEPRTLKYESASRPANFFFTLSVKVEGGVGVYNLVVRLRDAMNGQVVERRFPFVVANKRQEPSARGPRTAPVQAAKSGAPGERARPLDCRQYFPQIGQMISVQCPQ